MKKAILTLTSGVLLAAATAQAQVDIYITGSTAFRANAYRSIRHMFDGNVPASQNPADPASGVNTITFSGTITPLFGAQTVTVHAAYNGSAAGVQALVQNQNLTFLTSSTAGNTNTTTHTADLAFSDVFQATTAFPAPLLSDTNVGVLPFAWVKSTAGGTANLTNVTIQQLQSLLSGGIMPLSYFTSIAADDATLVYLVGRDSGSGTRITAEKDALFVGTELEWAPDASCNWNVYGGFSSGSGVAGVLSGACGPALGYLGLSDAVTVNSGNNIIRYNGNLPFFGTIASPDFTPVRKGLYSFWTYEHLFKRTSSPANVTTFRATLANEINNDLATSTSAIQIGTMGVSRNADGGPISP